MVLSAQPSASYSVGDSAIITFSNQFKSLAYVLNERKKDSPETVDAQRPQPQMTPNTLSMQSTSGPGIASAILKNKSNQNRNPPFI